MGYVYVIGDADKCGYYKIGATRSTIEKRMKSLQTGNSGNLYLVTFHKTKHPFMVENMMHKQMVNQQVLNEWYELSEDDLRGFQKRCEKIEENLNALKDNEFFNKKFKD